MVLFTLMQGEGQKISLSMKVVNQTTGQDLDPNQLQTSLVFKICQLTLLEPFCFRYLTKML